MALKELKQSYLTNTLSKSRYIDRMHAEHRSLFDYAEYLSDSGIDKIEITAKGVIMTVAESGIKLWVSERDKRIIPIEILNFGAHEAAEWKTISSLLPEAPSVLDIGANAGWYSIRIARDFSNAEVHAFEPVPRTFEQLVQNLTLNNIDTVRVNAFGLWETEGEMDIYFDPALSGAASARNILETSHPATRCRFTTLDGYRKSLDRPVDFIKCDVEGGELFVFKGGLETLENDKPMVFAELLRKWAAKFDYHPQEVIRLFRALGYGCYEIAGGRLSPAVEIDDNTTSTNFFFFHNKAHRAVVDKLIARQPEEQ